MPIYISCIDAFATVEYGAHRCRTAIARMLTQTCCAVSNHNEDMIISAAFLNDSYEETRNVTDSLIAYYKYDIHLSISSLMEWFEPTECEILLRIITQGVTGRQSIRIISIAGDGKDIIQDAPLFNDTELSNIESITLEQLYTHSELVHLY